MMAWYAQPVQKNLEKLIETKPLLETMFEDPDFITQLKAFNPKLLQYITNTPDLIRQAVQYIILPPSESDSLARKHRYPLLAVEMIETEAISVLSGFFKPITNNTQSFYIDILFEILDQKDILPLSAGYFFRVCLCMMTLKLKDMTEYIYLNRPEVLQKLLNHSQNPGVASCLQLFLNIQCSKIQGQHPVHRNRKIETVRQILTAIKGQAQSIDGFLLSNLIGLLTETIEKYFLIADGRDMMEPIIGQESIDMLIGLSLSENHRVSIPVLGLLVSLVNYYCFSGLNAQDKENPDNTNKNIERLDSQPLIKALNSCFSVFLQKCINAKKIGQLQFRILELLCHCVSLNSHTLLVTLKHNNFFAGLVDLLLKFQQANIMHTLVEKTFHAVFMSTKQIHQQYREHLFCEVDIIGRTANIILGQPLQRLRTRSNFAHLMRIIKIYSGIQTINQNIINSIKAYTQSWKRLAVEIIKPYEDLCVKELGTYVFAEQPIPVQFTVRQPAVYVSPSPSKNRLNDPVQEEARFLKTQQTNTGPVDCLELVPQILASDKFFQVPAPGPTVSNTQDPNLNAPVPQLQYLHKKASLNSEMLPSHQPESVPPPAMTKAGSFSETMERMGRDAEQKIKNLRSTSQQRRLTPARGNNNTSSSRITNPSPRRKQQNSWQSSDDDNKKQTASASSEEVKAANIPQARKPATTQSMIFTKKQSQAGGPALRKSRDQEMSKSMVNLSELKNIKVRFAAPNTTTQAKKFRKVEQKDMLLLNFLGIKIGK